MNVITMNVSPYFLFFVWKDQFQLLFFQSAILPLSLVALFFSPDNKQSNLVRIMGLNSSSWVRPQPDQQKYSFCLPVLPEKKNRNNTERGIAIYEIFCFMVLSRHRLVRPLLRNNGRFMLECGSCNCMMFTCVPSRAHHQKSDGP